MATPLGRAAGVRNVTASAGRVALVLGLCLLAAGCFSRTGDFGRPEAGPLNRHALPAFGKAKAYAREEPVSSYNLTDTERLMRRRATYLRFPPHTRDWFGRAVTELETNRVLEGFGRAHAPDRYYAYLRSDKFRSSQARYERLRFDITSDAELVSPFFSVASSVRRDDRERIRATRRRPDLTDLELANAKGRVHENALVIGQVSDALRYRLAAYRFAIDRLEIETPSDRIWDVNRAWRLLSGTIVAGENMLKKDEGKTAQAQPHRRSRIVTDTYTKDEPVPQK